MITQNPNNTELPDINWLIVELTKTHKSLQLIYQHGHSDLMQTEFYEIDRLMKKVISKIKHVATGRTVVLTNNPCDNIDLSINSITPIFTNFWTTDHDDNFDTYFHTNLNPDVAPVGFLEQVDSLLTISRKRPLIIYSTNDAQGIEAFNVIKKYIESQ